MIVSNALPTTVDPFYEYTPSQPEKVLLLRVLQRAIQDLEHKDITLRNSAIVWFHTWVNYLPKGLGISYKDVREHIDLLPSQLEHIRNLIGFNAQVITPNANPQTHA